LFGDPLKMYSTPVYLYQQIQPVLLTDTSGAYFNMRWNPVYSKNLKLNLGVDNVILFQFYNQDQKPVNISGSTFTFRIISQNGDNTLYEKEMVSLNDATGRVKVTITSAETLRLPASVASYSIAVASGNLEQAVYTDANSGARGTIDIVDSVLPEFTSSAILTIPDQAPSDNIYNTSTIVGTGDSLVTLQLDTGALTGNLSVQGSDDATAATPNWYSIDFDDLNTGNTVSQINFSNATEKRAINVEGFHPYLRLNIGIASGNVTEIVYR